MEINTQSQKEEARAMVEWSKDIATEIAISEGIELTKAHWEIIYLARKFYSEYDLSPEWRGLVTYARNNLGDSKGSSLYLMSLFPGSSTKGIARIAGIPKPASCL
tara:strand:+ start:234 stop:548 length:315 start_codon:yes stop_codon:yes gene_type:complete